MTVSKLYKYIKVILLAIAIVHNDNIVAPIVISQDMIVLDGNTRLRLARGLGYKTIKAVRLNAKAETINIDELEHTY